MMNDNKNEMMHYEEESQRVLRILTEDFECINYVSLQEDRYDDASINYRISDTLKKYIQGWETEHNFHKKLNLLINTIVHEDDKGRQCPNWS